MFLLSVEFDRVLGSH